MRSTRRHPGPPVLAACVLATSTAVGIAEHWFAAWLLILAGSLVVAGWTSRINRHRQQALRDARAELAQVAARQRTLKNDLDQARREARAVQQEARADLELLRAEVTVASHPDDPDDRSE